MSGLRSLVQPDYTKQVATQASRRSSSTNGSNTIRMKGLTSAGTEMGGTLVERGKMSNISASKNSTLATHFYTTTIYGLNLKTFMLLIPRKL